MQSKMSSPEVGHSHTNFKLWLSAGGGGSGERGDLTVGLRKKDCNSNVLKDVCV